MTRDEQIRQIEKDRKEREAGLTLYLLALAGRAKRNVTRAIRVGVTWAQLLRSTLLGNEALDLPGGVPVLSRAMADTHSAGLRRVATLVGVKVAPPPLDALAARYRPAATAVLERIAGSLETASAAALAGAVEADRIIADVRAVGEAFERTGWTPAKPSGAQTEATAAVTQSYATGMGDGVRTPEVAAVMSGLRFINPLDETTTTICRARHGVVLPLDHPWWFAGNFPPCHWGCRSVVLPTTGRVTFTQSPPTFPPAEEGWGQWAGILSAFPRG